MYIYDVFLPVIYSPSKDIYYKMNQASGIISMMIKTKLNFENVIAIF